MTEDSLDRGAGFLDCILSTRLLVWLWTLSAFRRSAMPLVCRSLSSRLPTKVQVQVERERERERERLRLLAV